MARTPTPNPTAADPAIPTAKLGIIAGHAGMNSRVLSRKLAGDAAVGPSDETVVDLRNVAVVTGYPLQLLVDLRDGKDRLLTIEEVAGMFGSDTSLPTSEIERRAKSGAYQGAFRPDNAAQRDSRLWRWSKNRTTHAKWNLRALALRDVEVPDLVRV
jgi:hypothetical protein